MIDVRNSLQTRLTRTYIGLAVIPLIVLGLLVTWQGFLFEQEALSRQEQLAKRISAEVDGVFRGITEEMDLLIQLEGPEGLSAKSAFSPLLSFIAHDFIFEELTYIDKNGDELNHETRLGIVTLEDMENHQDEKEFQIPVTREINYFSPFHNYPATGEPVLDIAVPVTNELEGTIEGVLIAEVRLIKVWEVVENISLNRGQSVYIVDANGWVIAHPNRSTALGRVFFTPPQTPGVSTGLDAPVVLLATAPIRLGEQNLTVVVEQSLPEAFSLPLNTIGMTLTVFFATLSIAILIGLRSVRQIVDPIQDLAKTARAIRAGEWHQHVQVQTNDELGDLGEAFNLMVSRLQTSMTNLEEEVIEKNQAEVALRQAEARYRTLVEHLPAITYVDDASTNFGHTLYISPQIESLLGYKQEEWVNLEFENWLKLMHPDDQSTFLEKYTQCHFEGKPLECEFRMFNAQGQIIWFHDQAFRLNDQNGRPWIIQGVMVDITELKKSEEEIRRLNAELEQRVLERTAQLETANKELESFTYSISHDLRTPLRGIVGFSNLLLNNPQHHISEEGQHYLNRVNENAQRMAQLVDDLLKFSRISRYPVTKQAIHPTTIAQEALDDLSLEVNGRKLHITLGDLPPCQADPSLLRQVFANLLSNAIKYTRNKEVAEIEIGWIKHEQKIAYYVRDNGTGFNMQYADKLFGVFQRLHSLEEFEGTGVGLAITHRIIQRHGGKIWAEAEPEKGATFFFIIET